MEDFKLPSEFQIGEKVKLSFGKKKVKCSIAAVRFHDDYVTYDLVVFLIDTGTIIENVSDCFLSKIEE